MTDEMVPLADLIYKELLKLPPHQMLTFTLTKNMVLDITKDLQELADRDGYAIRSLPFKRLPNNKVRISLRIDKIK